MYYSRDTIIDDSVVAVYEKEGIYQEDGEIKIWPRQPVYIRSANGVVEFSTTLNFFDTLYNFQLEIGESWSIPERNFFGELEERIFKRTVRDTFSVIRNNQTVYCQAVEATGDIIGIDTIYQDFGSRYSYILPWENFEQYSEGSNLRCFKNDRLDVLDFEAEFIANFPNASFTIFQYDCDQLSSIANTPVRSSSFSLSPNPVSNILQILSQEELIEQVDIFSLSGQLLLEANGGGSTTDVNVISLPPGMYIVLINEKYFEKLMVVD